MRVQYVGLLLSGDFYWNLKVCHIRMLLYVHAKSHFYTFLHIYIYLPMFPFYVELCFTVWTAVLLLSPQTFELKRFILEQNDVKTRRISPNKLQFLWR